MFIREKFFRLSAVDDVLHESSPFAFPEWGVHPIDDAERTVILVSLIHGVSNHRMSRTS
jgi:hypothetical protein